MAKLPQLRVTTKERIEETDLPEHVLVALREIASQAKEGLLALSVGVGMQVVSEIFEEEVTSLVGHKGRHDRARTANRHGHESRQVVLGGRLVKVGRPRVRRTGGGRGLTSHLPCLRRSGSASRSRARADARRALFPPIPRRLGAGR